ncbi:hypothetical protein [Gilliamella sp. Imp1-1]|uniref:hypothetical protein n=1 Tax=Gilliamella sp. Imp1-1 TaxID=3120248 RepID=UPI000461AC3A|nr:hypothetical protein [Gilliamella apicola]KDN09487.1 hypothetical protein GAPWKB30_1921 [Gilliamella apicola]OCG56605.1 hypothetical protein A9G38_09695 [Gilliamella apicola]
MQYHFCHKTWQAYVLNLSNNFIRRVFAQNLFISLKLSTKSFLKIQLVLALLLLLPYSLESQALSATTSNTIQGTAPYLTLDDGTTKLTTTDDLLTIKLSDGRIFTPQNNPSSLVAPIKLPNVGDTLADIEMIVQPSSDSVSLNELVAQNKWRDDDGDGQDGLTADGVITLSITDKNNKTVNRSDALTTCNAPYKVELSNTKGYLKTKYGVPETSNFAEGSVTYYINPNASDNDVCIKVEFARPLISFNPMLDGPADIWNMEKGFLVQSTNPELYKLNFPTTGAHNLYFDLLITGVDINELTWKSVTHEGITATVTREVAEGMFPPEDFGKVVTRVRLTGPAASDSQKESDSPGRIAVPDLPQVFELEGRDSSGNVVVKYGFKLKQWFVSRGGDYFNRGTFSEQESWCNSLGYRLPQIKDLTNAKCGEEEWSSFPCSAGVHGGMPSSTGNHIQRQIGAGFLTEWYPGMGSIEFPSYIWTSDTVGSNQFIASANQGYVYNDPPNYPYSAICTTP